MSSTTSSAALYDPSHAISDDRAFSDGSSESSRASIDLPPTRHDSPIGLGLTLQHQKEPVPVSSLLVKDTPSQILDIIFDYAIHKFDDSQERLLAGRARFLAVIDKFVQAGERVETCLPAFPFKSANKIHKVLGSLPDKAEELALERLNTMCLRIKKVYKPGARVTIISDGITYNDLLCISDRDTWAYGEVLRRMAAEKRFTCITFARLKDLLDVELFDNLREITYVANCSNFRRLLINEFAKDDIDVDKEIRENPDTRLTYLGYRKFLESDLKYIFTTGKNLTRNQYKRDVKYLAKQMIFRGYAYAGAVKRAFPDYLRLSIHESIGEHKMSISLLNTQTGYTTPWHCSVAMLANGEWVSAPAGEFHKDNRLELVYEEGRPSYFKEKLRMNREPRIDSTNAPYLQTPKPFQATRSGYSSPNVSSPQNGWVTPTASASSVFQSHDPSQTQVVRLTNNNDRVDYGRRLIPQIMDQLAATDPDRVVFTLASGLSSDLAYREISAKMFTQAVNKTACWLRGQVDAPALVQPIGYIGPHDLRHVLLTYAAVKVGYAALYLSPKNTTQGAIAVLEATGCKIWAKAGDARLVPLVKNILEDREMQLLELPSLDDLLDAADAEPFPLTKNFAASHTEPFCYLHTSGSTGVPKPIPWTHGLIGTMDAVRLLPPMDGMLPWTTDWKEGDKIYSSFPMCHGAGIIMDILMPALFGLNCVLGPRDVIPNISLIDSLVEGAGINIWSMVPALVDELGETPNVLDKFHSPTNKFICASGGPVSLVSASKVNEVIRVLNLTGTTEGLFIGNMVVPREDWSWFAFHPYSGFEFKEIEPGVFEHWVHRNEHASLFQGIFHTFPDQNSINFKDLYRQHPSKPNLWQFNGRNDDLVVFSSGYKILPLELEALVTTHPAIDGCLVVGAGKTQPGLLVELKNPHQPKTDDLMDSIWHKIETSISMCKHTIQLSRDYVAFARPDQPFVRTDKRTVKRKATLGLYDDYIERFYKSRAEETSFVVDATSLSALQRSVRQILAFTLPDVNEASPDDDLFALGLDSLGVSAAVNAIRAATKGLQKLAPRHLYANPTLAKFTATLEPMIADAKNAEGELQRLDNKKSRVQRMLAQRKAHQSFRLNPFDYVNPNHYMGLVFYFPLNEGVSFEGTFANMQAGLNRTLELIPALGGKMIRCSEDEIGFVNGDLCVAVPPFGAPARDRLVYKDLSEQLPSFEQLRHGGFVPSAFKDEVVLPQDTFPQLPANILVAQANFVKGGCILAVDLNHCCLDGVGAVLAIKVWAENCRFLQGDKSATCEFFDAESFNHSLPEVLHDMEGFARPVEEIDASVWDLLPFMPTAEDLARQTSSHKAEPVQQPLRYPLHSVWPLPAAERKLDTTMFVIAADKLEQLKQDALSDPSTAGGTLSISDIVQALFWRSALRARHKVAKANGRDFEPDECSILELPTDGRPYFSSLLPSTYMGSLLTLNRTALPIETLCSTETSVFSIAQVLRKSAARMTPSLVHDAFTLLQSLKDHSRFSTANMGLNHMHAMISNMILFQMDEISFGGKFFDNGGEPETMRPQLHRGGGRFRFLVVFPLRKDGGVELVLGTFPEERKALQKDDDFAKYADLVDVSVWD